MDDMMIKLIQMLYSTYREGKEGNRCTLKYKAIDACTCRGGAVDFGIVTGDGFSVKKTDIYGNNPVFDYSDELGSIFLPVKALDKALIRMNGHADVMWQDIEENEKAQLYVQQAICRMEAAGSDVTASLRLC